MPYGRSSLDRVGDVRGGCPKGVGEGLKHRPIVAPFVTHFGRLCQVGIVEERTGYGGGFMERDENLQYKARPHFMGYPGESNDYNTKLALWEANPFAAVRPAGSWPPTGCTVIGYGGS
jgi:hypothetical protein